MFNRSSCSHKSKYSYLELQCFKKAILVFTYRSRKKAKNYFESVYNNTIGTYEGIQWIYKIYNNVAVPLYPEETDIPVICESDCLCRYMILHICSERCLTGRQQDCGKNIRIWC